MIFLIELIIRQLVWWVSVLAATLWEKDRPNGHLRRAITRKVMIRDTGEGIGHWQRRRRGSTRTAPPPYGHHGNQGPTNWRTLGPCRKCELKPCLGSGNYASKVMRPHCLVQSGGNDLRGILLVANLRTGVCMWVECGLVLCSYFLVAVVEPEVTAH